MTNPYLIFAVEDGYEPHGGWRDYLDCAPSLDAARKRVLSLCPFGSENRPGETRYEWAQVVCLVSMRIVEEYYVEYSEARWVLSEEQHELMNLSWIDLSALPPSA